MNFKIKNIEISNLRNIPFDSPLYFDLSEQMITIFDGPNGYGKTTFFDAVELLLTGSIGHFFDGLYNRGSESHSSVAKDRDKDTIIKAEIVTMNKEVYKLTRTFNWKNFDSRIDSQISVISSDGKDLGINNQSTLFDFFGITESIFDIGMYISQNDSLQFLKLPYKKRKDAFSAIIGTDVDDHKKDYLGELRKELVERKKSLISKYDKKIDSLSMSIDEYDKLLSLEKENNQLVEYTPLFPDKDFDFDKENVSISKIEHYLGIIKQIENYIENRENFLIFKRNEKFEGIKSYSKKDFAALFFEKEITKLKSRQQDILYLNQFEEIFQKFIKDSKPLYNNSLFDNVFKNSILKINEYANKIEQLEQKLTGINLKKNRLIEARGNLNEIHSKDHYLGSETCPYCGKTDENLNTLYETLSNIIGENESDLSQNIQALRKEKKLFIKEVFSKEVNEYIAKYKSEMGRFNTLRSLFNIDSKELRKKLEVENLIESFMNYEESFENNYNKLMSEIENKITMIPFSFGKAEQIEFQRLAETYFDNRKPNITLKEIEEKKSYLAYIRASQGKQLKHTQEMNMREIRNKRTRICEQLDSKITEIGDLQGIYSKSIEEYHSDFLEDIKVPLYILSGRIMQTSPIGLGIEAKIDTRRIEFYCGTMNHDVVNMLSAGQLNGLMISIMLAVQKTYLSNKGIKLFMIDDPLQSIDDLSAHSFVDLLAQEFSENQIFISTHELDKTAMFYYKYLQAEIPINRKNLQYEYLK